MKNRCLKYLIFCVCLIFGIFPIYLIFLHRFQSDKLRHQIMIPRMTSNLEKHVTLQKKIKRDRLLCWICTGPPNHHTRAIHVKETWGKLCDVLLIMSSEEDKELGIIQLENVTEGRQWLWPKTVAAFKYIYKHHLDQVDWVMKADDDTFVIMNHLRDFLRPYKTNVPHFFGAKFKHSSSGGPNSPSFYFTGGAGYILSKAAVVKFILEALTDTNKCLSSGQLEINRGEDIEMANCLLNVGIQLSDTRDEYGRLRFLHYSPTFILYPLSNLDFFHKQSGWEFKKGTEGISDTAISFHYVQPNMMYVMDWIFHHAKRTKTFNGTKP